MNNLSFPVIYPFPNTPGAITFIHKCLTLGVELPPSQPSPKGKE